ncbi:TonB-dependent siderophore receptor, partial [Steroidobacter sp.]|uniref:TonB-dependent siderophore receptor n=1 Tax=Steroidobacter sp. TaxID=1978227 RepID=UPI001A638D09
INLVRKRGRADAETIVTAQGGSWSNFNAMLDVTGPLGFDGRLRGRAVATWRDRDYFYDTAHDKGRFFYGTLEADVTSSTLLVVGGSHDETRQTPWTTGLPRHKDGSSLGLGRDKALAASWNRWEQNSTEVFARLEQKLGERWTLALSATHSESDMFYIASNAIGSDAAGFGVVLGSTMGRLNSRGDETEATRDIYDLSLQGRFEWLGRQHTVLLGYDHQKIENNGWGLQLLWNQALPVDYDLASFGANSVPYPDGLRRTFVERNLTKKGGFYAKLQLQLAEPLKVAIGGRYASFDYSQDLDWYGVLPNPVPFHSALAYEEHDVFTPYVSVLFDVSRDWTLYGSVTEIYSSQANLLKGPLPGTSLDPISGRNYELGTKSSLRNGKLGFSFAVYRTERDGQAETDPAYPYTAVGDVGHSCCYLDSGEVLSQGIDTEVSGEVLPGLSMFAGYTLNENENKRANDAAWLSIAPKHIAKLWSSYRIPAAQGKWLVGGGVSVQSSRYFTGSARALNTTTGLYTGPYVPFDFTQGGYALWNAMARYDVNADWSVAINLNNILDKTYYRGINGPYSRNWYGEPRSFMVSLRGRF